MTNTALANRINYRENLSLIDEVLEREKIERENMQSVKEEDYDKYSKYMDSQIEGIKCEGYDFDPEKVIKINLRGQQEDNGWRSVVLNNGKRFKIQSSTGSCYGGVLEGKDSYKQLPEGCRFVIGAGCLSPVPTSCKEVSRNFCWDEGVEQDYQIFQWEATNKGWERMTSIREYWDDDVE